MMAKVLKISLGSIQCSNDSHASNHRSIMMFLHAPTSLALGLSSWTISLSYSKFKYALVKTFPTSRDVVLFSGKLNLYRKWSFSK